MNSARALLSPLTSFAFPNEGEMTNEWQGWSDDQKQVFLVHTYLGYKDRARQKLVEAGTSSGVPSEQLIRATAFRDMTVDFSGLRLFEGTKFPHIRNMELQTTEGTASADWLFSMARAIMVRDQRTIGGVTPQSAMSLYGSLKTLWLLLREQGSDLTSPATAFPESNTNAVNMLAPLMNGTRDFTEYIPVQLAEVEARYEAYFASKDITAAAGATKLHDDLGGIDLGGLDMQWKYLAKTDQTGADYQCAFRAGGSLEDVFKDSSANVIASDMFRLWHLYNKQVFWVNLNPTEPDRILAKELKNTLSGWVLAASDKKMKLDMAWMMHPDSTLGKDFWDGLYDIVGKKQRAGTRVQIPVTYRVWLVPGKIQVYANENEIYILNAEWKVMLENEYNLSRPGVSANAKVSYNEVQQFANNYYTTLVLPELHRRINGSSEYSKLRELLHAAIMAEWCKYYKKTFAMSNTFYGLGSSTIPDLFQAYKTSYEKGEYDLTGETRTVSDNTIQTEIRVYKQGGIDLTSLSFEKFERTSMVKLLEVDPEIRARLTRATYSPFGSDENGSTWLGASFNATGK